MDRVYWGLAIFIGASMLYASKLSLYLVGQIVAYFICCGILYAYIFKKNMYIWGRVYDYGKDDPFLMRELAAIVSVICIAILSWGVFL